MTQPLSEHLLNIQNELQVLLQHEPSSSKLESLAAAMLGRLLEIDISIANSGFQHGGDAGPAGRQGRRFRIEAKKYSDTTSLSSRELLGEIDHALFRDPALEAWILVATKSVSEQLYQDLVKKGESVGVPVVVFDWKSLGLSNLAALCAGSPDLVSSIFSVEAGDLARQLSCVSDLAIKEIKLDLQAWNLGFETIRRISHRRIRTLWSSPKESNSQLGQNAAGGAQAKKIKRVGPHSALDSWWAGPALNDAPAAVTGPEGTGKTWAALGWLLDHIETQPIILVIPSPAAALGLQAVSEIRMKTFLAEQLHELGGQRNVEHWVRRLERLLARPQEEGPVLTLLFDGLNQEPTLPWLNVLKLLQGSGFAGRVRVIITTRPNHFADKLLSLRSLVTSAVPVIVAPYGLEPNGELDEMLTLEGLARNDIHSDLIELARTPRLFHLVIKLRDRIDNPSKITVHRLLWEYGRDSFGLRADRSFSDLEWRAWLQELAQILRTGVNTFSLSTLSETASRRDLSANEVYARLSDIIDGNFSTVDSSGLWTITPNVVSHALAAALVMELSRAQQTDYEALDVSLTQWLDPISGLDQRAEILRAAVSITIESSHSLPRAVPGLLVTSWLQTQNLSESHRLELVALADGLVDPLLDAVENSTSNSQASARLLAINALRAIPRDNLDVFRSIVERSVAWLSTVSLGKVQGRQDGVAQINQQRGEHFKKRTGKDQPGPIEVLGYKLNLVDFENGTKFIAIPSLLEGYSLKQTLPVITAAAVNVTLSGDTTGWTGLKWLLLLNEIDPNETAEAVREIAHSIQTLPLEAGIHSAIPGMIAQKLLWSTGYECDELSASEIRSDLDNFWNYQKDYLDNPGTSFLALEPRHAQSVLSDPTIALHIRLQKTLNFWLDPDFVPPPSLIDEIRNAGLAEVYPEKLNNGPGRTFEDNAFETLEPVLARCAPDILADIRRRTLELLQHSNSEQRASRARASCNSLILGDAGAAASAKVLREKFREPESGDETFAASRLLLVELQDETAENQAIKLIESDIPIILIDFGSILKIPTDTQLVVIFARFSQGSQKQQHDLLCVISFYEIPLPIDIWNWVELAMQEPDEVFRGVAFRTLCLSDKARLGARLNENGWTWNASEGVWGNYYGSMALIAATISTPFEQLASRIAPSCLLEAVRMRGSDPTEVRLAADIFSIVLGASTLAVPDPGADLLVKRMEYPNYPSVYSLEQRREMQPGGDPFATLRAMQDPEQFHLTWKRTIDTAAARITEARRAGAYLFLADLNVGDFSNIWLNAREFFPPWLEGMDHLTDDFKRRVRLAEGSYLAICEALLKHEPTLGADLWRALRQTVRTRYIGAGEVNELIHIPFRAPDSPPVEALRETLLEPGNSPTDKHLHELAFAAAYNSKQEWLLTQIGKGQVSEFQWRRQQSVVLSGFVSNNELPIQDAMWEGFATTSIASLERRAIGFRLDEAASHHWWRAYIAAEDAVSAYAAWVLFTHTADRRSVVWSDQDFKEICTLNDPWCRKKLAHAELNRSFVRDQSRAREKDLDGRLLNTRTVDGVGPWGKASQQ